MHLHFPSEVPESWGMTDEPLPVPSATCFPRGYEMKRAHTQSTALPGSAGALPSTRIWHQQAPKAAAARELCARRLHQSLPSPHRRSGCLSFEAKPSFPWCHRPSEGHSWHQPPPPRSSLLPKPESTQEAGAAGQSHAHAWHGRHCGPPHPDTQQGMAWLWFQAGAGKIRGMRRGTKKNHLLPATKGEEGELWGRARGEREAASAAVPQ